LSRRSSAGAKAAFPAPREALPDDLSRRSSGGAKADVSGRRGGTQLAREPLQRTCRQAAALLLASAVYVRRLT
jgi:hypothetical protein